MVSVDSRPLLKALRDRLDSRSLVQPPFPVQQINGGSITLGIITSPGDHELNQRAALQQNSMREFFGICKQITPLLEQADELQGKEGVLGWAMRILVNDSETKPTPWKPDGVTIASPADHPYRIVAMAISLLLARGQQEIKYSAADTPSRWAKKFGISLDTLQRRIKDGKIRVMKDSTKSYRIAVEDLPGG